VPSVSGKQSQRPSFPNTLTFTNQSIDEDHRVCGTDSRAGHGSAASPEMAVEAGYSKEQSTVLIRPYHAELAEKDKRLTFTEFVKPDSVYRIVVATDAIGMGVNNPDALRVIQWKQPDSMFSLLQRAGRAASKSGSMANLSG
jgi:ATP-dependent helicase YprA (DUF1998 family)